MRRELAKKMLAVFSDEELEELVFYEKDLLEHYANGGAVECKGSDGRWSEVANPTFSLSLKWRKKPQKYKLLGIEIEGEPPLSEEPDQNQRIWYLTPEYERGYAYSAWHGGDIAKKLLKCSLIFATEEGAKTAAKALGWCDEEE